MKVIDMTGKKFGRLTVVEYAGMSNDHNAMWLCKCDCSNEVIVRGASLRKGNTKSCGCLKNERTSERRRKHGKTNTKTYYIWRAIKKRCSNINDKEYDCYGGRGIRICPEWENDFQAFYDHISKLPNFGEKGYTLDRINNDGDYEPGNIRFATYSEQAYNRRPKRWNKKQENMEV